MKRRSSTACGEERCISPAVKRTKVQAQRKFAQGSNNYTYSATKIVPKTPESVFPSFQNTQQTSSPENEECELNTFSKLPTVDDFLTFLCFRETEVLPDRLNYLNTPQFDALPGKKKPPKPNVTTSLSSSQDGDQGKKPNKKSKNELKNKKKAEYKLRSRNVAVAGKNIITKTSRSLALKHNQRLRSKTVVQAKICESKLQKTKPALCKKLKSQTVPKPYKKNEIVKKPVKHEFNNCKRVTRRNSMLEKPPENALPPPKEVAIKRAVSRKSAANMAVREISVCLQNSQVENLKKPVARSLRVSLPKVKTPVTNSLVFSKSSPKPATRSTRHYSVQEQSSSSQSLNSRPSRRTKEAAALYMEMLGKELLCPEENFDDDDNISIESFPELPNTEQHMRREKELKAMNQKKSQEKLPPRKTSNPKAKLFVKPCESCIPSKVVKELPKATSHENIAKEQLKIAERTKAAKETAKAVELEKTTKDSVKAGEQVGTFKESSKIAEHVPTKNELVKISEPVRTPKESLKISEHKKTLGKPAVVKHDCVSFSRTDLSNSTEELTTPTKRMRKGSFKLAAKVKRRSVKFVKKFKKELHKSAAQSKKESFESVEPVKAVSSKPAKLVQKKSDKLVRQIKNRTIKSAKLIKTQSRESVEPIKAVSSKSADLIKKQSKSESSKSTEQIARESSKPIEQTKKEIFKPLKQIKEASSKSAEPTKKEPFNPIEQTKDSRPAELIKKESDKALEQAKNELSKFTEQTAKESSKLVEKTKKELSKPVKHIKEVSSKFGEPIKKDSSKPIEQTKDSQPADLIKKESNKVVEHVKNELSKSTKPIAKESSKAVEKTKKELSKPIKQIKEVSSKFVEPTKKESSKPIEQTKEYKSAEPIKKEFERVVEQFKNDSSKSTEQTAREASKPAEKMKKELSKPLKQIKEVSSQFVESIKKEPSKLIEQTKESKSGETAKKESERVVEQFKNDSSKFIEQTAKEASRPIEPTKKELCKPPKQIKEISSKFVEPTKKESSRPIEQTKESKPAEPAKKESQRIVEQFKNDSSKFTEQSAKEASKLVEQTKKELSKPLKQIEEVSSKSTKQTKKESSKLLEQDKIVPSRSSEQARKELSKTEQNREMLSKLEDPNKKETTKLSKCEELCKREETKLSKSEEPNKKEAAKLSQQLKKESIKSPAQSKKESSKQPVDRVKELPSKTYEKTRKDSYKPTERNKGTSSKSEELSKEQAVKLEHFPKKESPKSAEETKKESFKIAECIKQIPSKSTEQTTTGLSEPVKENQVQPPESQEPSKKEAVRLVQQLKSESSKSVEQKRKVLSKTAEQITDVSKSAEGVKKELPKSVEQIKVVSSESTNSVKEEPAKVAPPKAVTRLGKKRVLPTQLKRDLSLERQRSCSDVLEKVVEVLDSDTSQCKNEKLVHSTSASPSKERKFVDSGVQKSPDSNQSDSTKLADSSSEKTINVSRFKSSKLVVSSSEDSVAEKLDIADEDMGSSSAVSQSTPDIVTTTDDSDFKKPSQERQFFSRTKTAKNDSKPMIQTVVSSNSKVFSLESKKIFKKSASPVTTELKEEISPKKSEAFSADNENSVYAFEPDLPTTSPPFRRLKPVTPPKPVASNSIAVQVNLESDSKIECSNSAETQVSSTTDCGGDRVFYIPIQTSTTCSTLGVAVKLDTDGASQKIIMSATLITNSPTCTTNTATTVSAKTSDVGTTCTLTETVKLSNKEQSSKCSATAIDLGKAVTFTDGEDEQVPCSSTSSIQQSIKKVPTTTKASTQSVRIVKINKIKKSGSDSVRSRRLGSSVSKTKLQSANSDSVITETDKTRPGTARLEVGKVKSRQTESEAVKLETSKTKSRTVDLETSKPDAMVEKSEPVDSVTVNQGVTKVNSRPVNSEEMEPEILKVKCQSLDSNAANVKSQLDDLKAVKPETSKTKSRPADPEMVTPETSKANPRSAGSETSKVKSRLADSDTEKPETSKNKTRSVKADSPEPEAVKGKSRPTKNKSVKKPVQESQPSSDKPSVTTKGEILEAPTFYPTEEEFNDPLEYIDKIRSEAEKFGLCRIVPPSNFRPECKVADEMRFTAYNQYVHKMLHRWGPNVKEMMAIKKSLGTQNTPFTHPLWIGGMEVDLPRLYHTVQQRGGLEEVIGNSWLSVANAMKIPPKLAQVRNTKTWDAIYYKYLLSYNSLSEDERAKLFEEIEKEWQDHLDNPSEDEVFEDIDECIVKGRTMSLSCFYRIARNTMMMCFGNVEEQEGPSTETIEEEFWKHVSERKSHICVHCGSIDSGTYGYGFSVAKNSTFRKHPWNLKVLTNNAASILRFLGPVMGVTVPTLHVGMLYSACCWYRDPHGLPWIEYLHTGANKIWYGIPDDHSEQFRKAMLWLVPRYCRDKKIWLPSDTVMIPPPLLTSQNVPLSRVVQNPGQFIVVFPKAFTSSISTGYLVSESVYFAHASWLNTGKQVFMDMQDSCEPSVFSFEQLLISIAEDTRPSLPILTKVLPLLLDLRDTEVSLRSQLKKVGLCTFEKLNVNIKRKSKRTYEEDSYECDTCHTNLFVSLVVNSEEQCHYCLMHAISLLNKKPAQVKHCTLMYAYTEEELDELIERVKSRIEAKSSKKSHGK